MIIEIKWRCNRCGIIHDTEDEADDCCPVDISEIYICPKCNEEHSHRFSAINCCPVDIEDGRQSDVSKKEMEAAGQIRLLD